MDEDDGRALLAAYLPASEPPEPPVTELLARARTIRRRRRTMLAGAASVAAVLVASAIAVGHPSAAPPARPAPTASLTAPATPGGPPCQDGQWVDYVVCHRSTLADGSLLVRRDYYQAGNSRQAVREVFRSFPDGRAVGLFLTYTNPSPADGAFERMARTLDELAAVVADSGVLRYLPRP